MIRYDDWQPRLFEAIAQRNTAVFDYGKFDCCLAGADLIVAITGDDPMADFRGRYKSAAGAARLLKRDGKGTLLKTLISLMPKQGSRRIPVASAGMGDLVLTKKGLHDLCRGQACGIAMGATAIFSGEVGWTHLPIDNCSAAFKIG